MDFLLEKVPIFEMWLYCSLPIDCWSNVLLQTDGKNHMLFHLVWEKHVPLFIFKIVHMLTTSSSICLLIVCVETDGILIVILCPSIPRPLSTSDLQNSSHFGIPQPPPHSQLWSITWYSKMPIFSLDLRTPSYSKQMQVEYSPAVPKCWLSE